MAYPQLVLVNAQVLTVDASLRSPKRWPSVTVGFSRSAPTAEIRGSSDP